MALTAECLVTVGAPPTPYRRRLHRPSRMTRGHSFRYGSMRAIAPGCRAWLHGRMGFRKTYVDVVANIDVDGRVTPLSIRWRDGRTFEIDRVHEAIRRASTRVGGTGIRYLVTVHGRDKYLFFEDPRWFVEEVVPEEAESAPPRR